MVEVHSFGVVSQARRHEWNAGRPNDTLATYAVGILDLRHIVLMPFVLQLYGFRYLNLSQVSLATDCVFLL